MHMVKYTHSHTFFDIKHARMLYIHTELKATGQRVHIVKDIYAQTKFQSQSAQLSHTRDRAYGTQGQKGTYDPTCAKVRSPHIRSAIIQVVRESSRAHSRIIRLYNCVTNKVLPPHYSSRSLASVRSVHVSIFVHAQRGESCENGSYPSVSILRNLAATRIMSTC